MRIWSYQCFDKNIGTIVPDKSQLKLISKKENGVVEHFLELCLARERCMKIWRESVFLHPERIIRAAFRRRIVGVWKDAAGESCCWGCWCRCGWVDRQLGKRGRGERRRTWSCWCQYGWVDRKVRRRGRGRRRRNRSCYCSR
jgi:hypothetical protein